MNKIYSQFIWRLLFWHYRHIYKSSCAWITLLLTEHCLLFGRRLFNMKYSPFTIFSHYLQYSTIYNINLLLWKNVILPLAALSWLFLLHITRIAGLCFLKVMLKYTIRQCSQNNHKSTKVFVMYIYDKLVIFWKSRYPS